MSSRVVEQQARERVAAADPQIGGRPQLIGHKKPVIVNLRVSQRANPPNVPFRQSIQDFALSSIFVRKHVADGQCRFIDSERVRTVGVRFALNNLLPVAKPFHEVLFLSRLALQSDEQSNLPGGGLDILGTSGHSKVF